MLIQQMFGVECSGKFVFHESVVFLVKQGNIENKCGKRLANLLLFRRWLYRGRWGKQMNGRGPRKERHMRGTRSQRIVCVLHENICVIPEKMWNNALCPTAATEQQEEQPWKALSDIEIFSRVFVDHTLLAECVLCRWEKHPIIARFIIGEVLWLISL